MVVQTAADFRTKVRHSVGKYGGYDTLPKQVRYRTAPRPDVLLTFCHFRHLYTWPVHVQTGLCQFVPRYGQYERHPASRSSCLAFEL